MNPKTFDAARRGVLWQEQEGVVRVVVPRSGRRVRLGGSQIRMALLAIVLYILFWAMFVFVSGALPSSQQSFQWWTLSGGALLVGVTWLLLKTPPPVVFVLSPDALRVKEGAGRLSSIELSREHLARIEYHAPSRSVRLVCDEGDPIDLHVSDTPEVDRWVAEQLNHAMRWRSESLPLVSPQ